MKIGFRKVSAMIATVNIALASCSSESGTGHDRKQEPVVVTIAKAEAGNNTIIRASGRIESLETAVISTRVMGFITAIKVKPGDHVKKGQLLATISNADIRAKRGQTEALVAEAEASLNDAQKDYERYAELYEQRSASAKEFDDVTLRYNAVKAKTDAARQMQKEAEAMLAYTNLTAPIDGVVTQKNADEGSMASPGMPIVVLEQTDGHQVNVFISERDIAKVRPGAAAEVQIKSTGKKTTGRVSEVSPSSQRSGGQYVVKVRLPDGEQADIYSGMYAHVSIVSAVVLSRHEEPLLIPVQALVQRDQLNGLYTISEAKTALLRWVTIGKTHGNQVEILSGLNADETFIVNAEGKLYNGVPVSVKDLILSDNH